MKFETRLDRQIYKTIQGCDATRSQTPAGIIGSVDAVERLVVTREELSDSLQRLISAGHVVEITTHRFCDALCVTGPAVFSGLTQTDYCDALQEYRDRIQRRNNSDGTRSDEFVWRKLVLRWKTKGDRWPTFDDENGAEELARTIDRAVADSGLGEINGFEFGAGRIDVLVFGKATDADVNQLYERVAPLFRTFECPAGSSIIRIFNERNEDIESDVVPDRAE